MPKSIEISLAPDAADGLLLRLEGMRGILGVARQRSTSLLPLGDTLVFHTTSDGARDIFQVFAEMDLNSRGLIRTNEPGSLVFSGSSPQMDVESNEATWEEMASLLRGETNVNFNDLALMFLAGGVCASGLWSDSLAVVIGSMLIASAFGPFVRVPFGLVTGLRGMTTRGAAFCLWGYLLLAAGAGVSTLILAAVGPESTPLAMHPLIRYWSSFSAPSVLSSALASLAGVIMFCGLRSVHTSGVMITLSLVPGMAIAGMAISRGDLSLAGWAVARWGVDAGLVLVSAAVVLAVKQKVLHRRQALG